MGKLQEILTRRRALRDAAASWLELERLGQEVLAEQTLSKVFRHLPSPSPSPALSSRTLRELGFDPIRVGRSISRPHWAFRLAVSLVLTLSGLTTVLYAPMLLSAISLRGSANWIVDVAAGFLTGVSRRLAGGVTLWEVIARAGSTASEVIATPQVLGLMLATVLFGLATLRLLAGIVVVERSSYHA